jgi:hypothetical protein
LVSADRQDPTLHLQANPHEMTDLAGEPESSNKIKADGRSTP